MAPLRTLWQQPCPQAPPRDSLFFTVWAFSQPEARLGPGFPSPEGQQTHPRASGPPAPRQICCMDLTGTLRLQGKVRSLGSHVGFSAGAAAELQGQACNSPLRSPPGTLPVCCVVAGEQVLQSHSWLLLTQDGLERKPLGSRLTVVPLRCRQTCSAAPEPSTWQTSTSPRSPEAGQDRPGDGESCVLVDGWEEGREAGQVQRGTDDRAGARSFGVKSDPR